MCSQITDTPTSLVINRSRYNLTRAIIKSTGAHNKLRLSDNSPIIVNLIGICGDGRCHHYRILFGSKSKSIYAVNLFLHRTSAIILAGATLLAYMRWKSRINYQPKLQLNLIGEQEWFSPRRMFVPQSEYATAYHIYIPGERAIINTHAVFLALAPGVTWDGFGSSQTWTPSDREHAPRDLCKYSRVRVETLYSARVKYNIGINRERVYIRTRRDVAGMKSMMADLMFSLNWVLW